MTRIVLLGAIILLVACEKKQGQVRQTSSGTIQDTVQSLNVQPDNFVEIDNSGITIFPLSMTETSYGKRSYKDLPNNDYWNILFYNSNTVQYHLLTNKKILIQGFYLGHSEDYDEPPAPSGQYIFYVARTDDYNQDSMITYVDPAYLFVSDRSGHNFRQISPTGYDLSDWKYLKSSNKVILSAIIDKNHDRVFNDKEEHLVFETSLNESGHPKLVFATSFTDSLKISFGRYWHRIKQ